MADWDDDFADEFSDEGFDEFDDGEADTVACPECGTEVYEDADQCPVCGHWIVHATSPLEGRPTWFVALGILGIVAVVAVLSGLLGVW